MTIHFSIKKNRTPPFAPHIEWCPQIARGEVNPERQRWEEIDKLIRYIHS
jgi:hypothetical protein